MSLIDKLLQMDTNKIEEKPTEVVELPRLTKILGGKAEFLCQALDGETHSDIQKRGVDLSKKGSIKDIKMYDMKLFTLIDGVVEPSLKDKRLLEHFKCVTPKDLIKKMFLPGEIDELYNTINELSGFEKDEDDEEDDIKNS